MYQNISQGWKQKQFGQRMKRVDAKKKEKKASKTSSTSIGSIELLVGNQYPVGPNPRTPCLSPFIPRTVFTPSPLSVRGNKPRQLTINHRCLSRHWNDVKHCICVIVHLFPSLACHLTNCYPTRVFVPVPGAILAPGHHSNPLPPPPRCRSLYFFCFSRKPLAPLSRLSPRPSYSPFFFSTFPLSLLGLPHSSFFFSSVFPYSLSFVFVCSLPPPLPPVFPLFPLLSPVMVFFALPILVPSLPVPILHYLILHSLSSSFCSTLKAFTFFPLPWSSHSPLISFAPPLSFTVPFQVFPLVNGKTWKTYSLERFKTVCWS